MNQNGADLIVNGVSVNWLVGQIVTNWLVIPTGTNWHFELISFRYQGSLGFLDFNCFYVENFLCFSRDCDYS